MSNVVKRHAKKDQVTIHPDKSNIVLLNRHRVNPGKCGQAGKYGQMTYTSHVQLHRSVTKKCFIKASNNVYSALLHPYTT